jgi:tRNA (guanine-N7-)-methyltransferase
VRPAALFSNQSGIGILGSALPKKVDLCALFANERPVALDVGSGKGLFLRREAARHPGTNFLGVEWSAKYFRIAVTCLVELELRNVRVVLADAREFVQRLDDATLDSVHIYFPDPWWKRRHHKRRLYTPEFFGQVARRLRANGRLYLATDVLECFEAMSAHLGGNASFQRLSDVPSGGPSDESDYRTHFERKYRREGRPIYQACFARTAVACQ